MSTTITPRPNVVKTVCYVLRSFPEPSETFIAEEAASLAQFGVRTCILRLRPGNASVVHPKAQLLLEQVPWLLLSPANPMRMLWYLLRWMLASPWRTLRTAHAAWRARHRWCYFQSLEPAWWCRQMRVDFIHAHFADESLLYAACMSAWTGLPFGVTTHGYDLRDEPLGTDLARDLLQKADAVITISKYNRSHMVERYGLPATKVAVIHCGVDMARFSFVARSDPTAGAPMRLLNVGRLSPEKGQDQLLNAMQLLVHRGLALHLDLVGAGPCEADLKALAEALGVMDFVTFHGAQPQQKVIELHRHADVFVLPSKAEGLPVACIEAMALGTPCVATRITGIPELIEHRISGLLVDPDDAAGLAQAILAFHADPNLARRLRAGAREKVLAFFDRIRCTEQLLRAWSDAVR